MKVDCALLCDAATVREGLLHILGGGVTRLGRPMIPSQFGVQLALRIVVHPTEATSNHEGEVIVQTTDGARAAQVTFGFSMSEETRSQVQPGEELALPLVVPMDNFPLPAYGAYSVEVLIDHIHQISVPFLVHPLQSLEGESTP